MASGAGTCYQGLAEMTRTRRLKVLWLVVFALLLVAVVVLGYRFDPERPWLGLLLFGVLLLVPGRLQGLFYRSFFQAAKIQRAGQPDEALVLYQEFLDEVRAHRWMKPLLWLAWTVYTTDVAAMTLNNMGACHLVMGELEAAEEATREALKLDPLYPLPYVTLATLALLNDDQAAAEEHVAKAAELGYGGTSVDVLVQRSQTLLAHIEGH